MKTVLTMLLVLLLCHTPRLYADSNSLDLNDVTWLWPPPHNASDLDRVLSIADLQATDGTEILTDETFQDVLSAADSDAPRVEGHQIGLPSFARTKTAWRIAAFRVDPTAPGGHEAIRQIFGERPQIRLVLQPVEVSGAQVEVHDITMHLVFNFLQQRDDDEVVADREKFRDIVSDLRELKQFVADQGVETGGKPLGIHPGLDASINDLPSRVKSFLSKHLHHQRLGAMAIMGLDEPEPWIFLALAKDPSSQRFGPVPFLPAQMLNFRGATPEVSPLPRTNNLNPVLSGTVMPSESADRRGVATAPLFGNAAAELDAFAIIGKTQNGQDVHSDQIRNRDIPDIIADPKRSHFFNTDCISCHTETRRRLRLSISAGEFAFTHHGKPAAIDPSVLPKDDWNVRNLGWFQPPRFIGGGPTVATVTQRTANETAEVVNYISTHYADPNVRDDAATRDVIFLDQGWSDAERQDFYYLSQGSQLIPYSWFLSLERSDSSELLRSDGSMHAFGFIPQPPGTVRNPHGLPIGFVMDSNPSSIMVKQGFLGAEYPVDAYPPTNDWLGLTCAACHTAEIVHDDKVIRIDGGAAMSDVESFLSELARSLRATVSDQRKYQRFEQRVRENAGGDIDTTGLRRRVSEYTPVIEKLVARNKADHPYGLGRLDAFGAILNQLCAASLEIPENAQPANAPVSYPFLWYTPHMDWVQWNSTANIPISRNVGEVLGVFAHAQLTGTPAAGQFDSSARVDFLHRLETQLAKLRAPEWPLHILGEIDQKKAAAGEVLFNSHCARCHNTRDENGEFRMTEPNAFGKQFIKTTNIPLDKIGTDPLMARNFVLRLAKPGDLNRVINRTDPSIKSQLDQLSQLFERMQQPPPDFSQRLPAGMLLGAAVRGVIEKQMQRELANQTPEEQQQILLELRDHRESASPPNGGAGYKAGPLAGVWATAPFGHAGAVPNLYQWLLPENERVKRFHVGNLHFDPKHIGFVTDACEHSFVFETETAAGDPIPGNSNAGHTGEHQTEFTDEQRFQIIEYIKTLK